MMSLKVTEHIPGLVSPMDPFDGVNLFILLYQAFHFSGCFISAAIALWHVLGVVRPTKLAGGGYLFATLKVGSFIGLEFGVLINTIYEGMS